VFKHFCLVLGLLILLAGCDQPQPPVQQESYVFGTRVEILVAGVPEARAREAAGAVLREFDRLHRTYHAWQPSELTRVNEALAAGRQIQVGPEMLAFIREARELAHLGAYRFDPGIGALIRLWGFHSDEFKPVLPDPAALAAWRRAPASIAQLQIEGDRIGSTNPRVALDFGGYLKGAALDLAAARLKQAGVHNALINIGGNIMALGNKNGKPWRVGIQHPRQPGALATLELRDGEAIGTSGDYQRYFEVEGRRYSHLLDPATGEPVTHTQAVTVLMPPGPRAGTLSDALSKPIFIAGPEHWQAAARATGAGQVLRIAQDGRIQVTRALRARLVFMGKPPALEEVP